MSKKYSIIVAFLFLSFFLVKIDRIGNVAKADCWGDYNTCYDNAEDDSTADACSATYDSCYANESAETQEAADKTCGDNAYLSGSDCYCNDGYSEDSNGDCKKIDLSSEECETDGDCVNLRGEGYSCSSGACVLDNGDECKDDTDCVNNIGPGYACVSKTCQEKASTATTTKSTTATTTSGQTVTLSAGSLLNALTGLVTLPNGTSYNLAPSSVTTLCASGICSTTTTTTNNGTSSGNGGVYNTGNVAGLSGGACGTGFTPIGGVCFPANTGLSSAPIYVILSNIFSWLMGLFTTFAVIAFVISGIQYLTSAGDENQIETAKRNAMYALLGVIIGLSGFVIVQAIASALSGNSYFF